MATYAKSERTRAAILDHALGLFASRGYAETTMQDVADAAGVVRQTVLNHFRRKEDLVAAWGARRRDDLDRALAEARLAVGTAPERLLELYRVLARLNGPERELARQLEPVFRSIDFHQVPHAVEALLAEGRREGSLRPDVDPRVAGEVLTAVYFDTLERWLADPSEPDLATPLVTRIEIVLRGLAP